MSQPLRHWHCGAVPNGLVIERVVDSIAWMLFGDLVSRLSNWAYGLMGLYYGLLSGLI